MALSKPFRWIFKIVAGLFALLALVLLIFAFVRVTVDLNSQKGIIEGMASRALGRKVTIEGDLQFATSLRPVVIVEGVLIGNPPEFDQGIFLNMGEARLEAAILPLFKGRIHVVDFDIQKLKMALRVDEQNRVNWLFSLPEAGADQGEEPAPASAPDQFERLSSDVFTLERLYLKDLVVTYLTPDMDDPVSLVIGEGKGLAVAGQPLKLSLTGNLGDETFKTDIRAASLEELIDENRTWMEIETGLAGATIQLDGRVDLARILQSLQLGLSIKGRQLERFNQLTGLDLPPVPEYGLEAQLAMKEKIVELQNFRLAIGSSELAGNAVLNDSSRPFEIKIDLTSPQVQIDDFDFPDWSARQEALEPDPEANPSVNTPPDLAKTDTPVLRLLSPDFLGRFNGRLSVTAEKVQSGQDMLGKGRLVTRVEAGRITIDPLELDVPGGTIAMSMTLKPGQEQTQAGIKVKSENFDIGVLARRNDPQTTMGGRINLDVDLSSSAKELSDLLANGNGYLDFSAQPENLRAGIIDLWAVNLITGILARADKGQSHIQCLLGRWRMDDGILASDALVIDTSRMRICGQGRINFKAQTVDLKVRPTPKRPEFFSLATPLGVQGHFSEFNVGVVKGGLAGTAVEFVTSPLHVPLRRVFSTNLPEDGRDVCDLPIGADNRPTGPLPGCRF